MEINEELLFKAQHIATECHREVNQLYDKKHPYSFHLEMVYKFGDIYAYLLPTTESKILALSACWTHDLIEDCRVTYNDIKEDLGVDIAELTYALTNEKGKNRKERANAKYYEGIRNTPLATFVKLCDRLANVSYSKQQGSSMLDAYRKDHIYFVSELFVGEGDNYSSMFLELEELIKP